MSENPSYFAIIPATVRYSKELCNGAKLLFGEITALTTKAGYCWASNAYFSKIYEKDANTISRWIKELSDAKFIKTVIDQRAGNERRIYLSLNSDIPIYKNDDTPIPKNVEYSNTRINNKKNVVVSTNLELTFKERKDTFYNQVNEKRLLYPSKYPSSIYIKFFEFWTEKNETLGGDKMRFEDQKFFDISKRLATFWKFVKEPEKAEMWRQDAETTQKSNQPNLFTDLVNNKTFH